MTFANVSKGSREQLAEQGVGMVQWARSEVACNEGFWGHCHMVGWLGLDKCRCSLLQEIVRRCSCVFMLVHCFFDSPDATFTEPLGFECVYGEHMLTEQHY